MTKDEMMAKIAELEAANENLIKTQGETVKGKIVKMIAEGVNTIEELASTLAISSKNVSSNLTRIRADLKAEGKTIVTQRIEDKTMLAVVELKALNW